MCQELGSDAVSRDNNENHKEEDEALHERASEFAENLFDVLRENNDTDSSNQNSINPSSIRIDNLLVGKAGNKEHTLNLCKIDNIMKECHNFLVEVCNINNRDNAQSCRDSNQQYIIDSNPISRERLVTLLGRRVRRRLHSGTQLHSDEINADGSCMSIMKWSQQSFGENRFDRYQRRAYQVMVGHFVLTYYKDAEFQYKSRSGKADFQNNKKNLENMTNNLEQLLMFFSGAGGSGKSEVIKQVLAYASKFCMNLQVKFDRNTIRVTAMTEALQQHQLGVKS